MKKLKVLLNNEWKLVFCTNDRQDYPVTTTSKEKALPRHAAQAEHCLNYFQNLYSNCQFKLDKK